MQLISSQPRDLSETFSVIWQTRWASCWKSCSQPNDDSYLALHHLARIKTLPGLIFDPITTSLSFKIFIVHIIQLVGRHWVSCKYTYRSVSSSTAIEACITWSTRFCEAISSTILSSRARCTLLTPLNTRWVSIVATWAWLRNGSASGTEEALQPQHK